MNCAYEVTTSWKIVRKQYCEIKFQVICQLNLTNNQQWHNIIHQTTIPQAFHYRGDLVSLGASVCGICEENSGIRTDICPILQFYYVSIIPPITHIHISTINVM